MVARYNIKWVKNLNKIIQRFNSSFTDFAFMRKLPSFTQVTTGTSSEGGGGGGSSLTKTVSGFFYQGNVGRGRVKGIRALNFSVIYSCASLPRSTTINE